MKTRDNIVCFENIKNLTKGSNMNENAGMTDIRIIRTSPEDVTTFRDLEEYYIC